MYIGRVAAIEPIPAATGTGSEQTMEMHRMSDETIYTLVTELNPQTVRALRLATLRPTPPIFKMKEWPNALGNSPEEAVGQVVRVDQDGRTQDFLIVGAGFSGELLLRHASDWDASHA